MSFFKIHEKIKQNPLKILQKCINFEKTENRRLFHWLQHKISQRLLVQNTWEEVRWKAYDPYFLKTKNFSSCLNPLWSLVQLRKFQKMSSSFLNPSSIAAEIKGDWGRVGKIEIFGKYEWWRFERTSSHVFWTNSRWEILLFVKAPGGTVWRFLWFKKKSLL